MRITEKEKNAFITALNDYEFEGELRLYGSRADDNVRGGDIDLLLLVKNEEQKSQLINDKYKILAAIKTGIGDQKIDFLITTFSDAKDDVFVQLIFPKSIVVHAWE